MPRPTLGFILPSTTQGELCAGDGNTKSTTGRADEVAELLQVTKAWVYAETRAKRIPHVPLGRYVRYRRSAVLQWITALERHSYRAGRVPINEE